MEDSLVNQFAYDTIIVSLSYCRDWEEMLYFTHFHPWLVVLHQCWKPMSLFNGYLGSSLEPLVCLVVYENLMPAAYSLTHAVPWEKSG